MHDCLLLIYIYIDCQTNNLTFPKYVFQYTQGVLHSIQNADGTVSIIQVDPNSQIITLPDGSTAQVQGIATVIICLSLTHIQIYSRCLNTN